LTWIKFFQPFCPLCRRALCRGTCRSRNVDFLQHARWIATEPRHGL